jgi:gliding motility-associated protein GldE
LEEPPEQLTIILVQSIISHEITFEITISMVIMALLLLCSALISGSEVAYFSLSGSEIDRLKTSKNRSEIRILELLERPKRLLATILIANNFINVGIVILSTFIIDGLFTFHNNQLKFFIQVIAVTFILLLIGEVIPKVYATRKAERLAGIMAIPLFYVQLIVKPVSSILVQSTNFIDKRIKKKGHNISVGELSHALELSSDENAKDEDQKILEGIVKFGNTDVKQIMTSRIDVVPLEITATYQEVVKTILDCGYSRIPVYKENFDTIVGVLYIKDLLPHLDNEDFDWTSILRNPFFVPENKKIDDLLREFQGKKIHLAIVVDEYGGTSGIVSLEDVLEEIVGEISDEFDDDDLVYSKLDEFNYVFEGKTPLNDVYRILEVPSEELFEEQKGDAETLAGFLLELKGKIPKKGEKVRFEQYLFTVEAADKRRVKRIKVTIEKDNTTESND